MRIRAPNILKSVKDERVVRLFKDTIPFVFQDKPDTSFEFLEPSVKVRDIEVVKGKIDSVNFALPFPVVSFEMETTPILSYKDIHGKRRIVAFHCIEVSINELIITELCELYDDDGNFTSIGTRVYDKNSDPFDYFNMKFLMYHLLEDLNAKKHGVVSVKRSFKFGSKKVYKHSQFTYVNTQRCQSVKTLSGKNIKYYKGFYVSAHWRKLHNTDSVGLDRLGERCVKGVTWVSHYYKGDDPIIKIRKVMK